MLHYWFANSISFKYNCIHTPVFAYYISFKYLVSYISLCAKVSGDTKQIICVIREKNAAQK